MKRQYPYVVSVGVILETNEEQTASRAIEVTITLTEPDVSIPSPRDETGKPNAVGAKMITQALIQGLAANIHLCQELGIWPLFDHKDYINQHLTKAVIKPVEKISFDDFLTT